MLVGAGGVGGGGSSSDERVHSWDPIFGREDIFRDGPKM